MREQKRTKQSGAVAVCTIGFWFGYKIFRKIYQPAKSE